MLRPYTQPAFTEKRHVAFGGQSGSAGSGRIRETGPRCGAVLTVSGSVRASSTTRS